MRTGARNNVLFMPPCPHIFCLGVKSYYPRHRDWLVFEASPGHRRQLVVVPSTGCFTSSLFLFLLLFFCAIVVTDFARGQGSACVPTLCVAGGGWGCYCSIQKDGRQSKLQYRRMYISMWLCFLFWAATAGRRRAISWAWSAWTCDWSRYPRRH